MPQFTVEDFIAALDPELRAAYLPMRAIFETYPDDAASQRALNTAMETSSPRPDVRREDLIVPRPDGTAFAVRCYRSIRAPEQAPCLLWFHGGGWVIGTLDDDDVRCDRIADRIDGVVISVDYRLAPENPFPAGLEDGSEALHWVERVAAELGVNRQRVAVGGASAGGNLAAALALLSRDRKGPGLALQLLIYPVMSAAIPPPVTGLVAAPGILLDQRMMRLFQQAYVGGNEADQRSPYYAPPLADDLTGLPPAYLMVGALDILRDDCIDYAGRLMKADVRTELHVYPGAFHGFENMVPDAEISRRAVRDYLGALARAVRP